jgi:acetolactate synthase-1/2/3 large subunit
MDSVPIICITGQVPTALIGSDAFQEADTVGITRPCTKHNWLVRSIDELPHVLHEAFYVAMTGRPGPVLIDIPKDVQFATGTYVPKAQFKARSYRPQVAGDLAQIQAAVELMATAKRPVLYTGGGVINSGKEASHLLRDLAPIRHPARTGSACWVCTEPTRPTWRCMTAMS